MLVQLFYSLDLPGLCFMGILLRGSDLVIRSVPTKPLVQFSCKISAPRFGHSGSCRIVFLSFLYYKIQSSLGYKTVSIPQLQYFYVIFRHRKGLTPSQNAIVKLMTFQFQVRNNWEKATLQLILSRIKNASDLLQCTRAQEDIH